MLSRRDVRRSVRFSLVAPLFGFSLLGMPIGTYLLAAVDGRILRLIVCTLVIATSSLMLLGARARRKNGLVTVALVGFASGLLSTSTSLSGTPVALFAATEDLTKDDFRSSLAAYGWLSILVSLVALRATGLLADQTLGLTILILPALLAGYWCGTRFFAQLSHSRFVQLIPVVIIVAGAIGLATAIW